jgi:hypothetical protein
MIDRILELGDPNKVCEELAMCKAYGSKKGSTDKYEEEVQRAGGKRFYIGSEWGPSACLANRRSRPAKRARSAPEALQLFLRSSRGHLHQLAPHKAGMYRSLSHPFTRIT